MFFLTCISIQAHNETNLMHYLSSVYSVTISLHISGLLFAYHQKVTMYICNNWYVLYVLVDCQLAWLEWNSTPNRPADGQLKRTKVPIYDDDNDIYLIAIGLTPGGSSTAHIYTQTIHIIRIHIFFVTSWWWATSKPETCRGIVTEKTEDKSCMKLVSLHAFESYSVVPCM
jgi:hypothetical protein